MFNSYFFLFNYNSWVLLKGIFALLTLASFIIIFVKDNTESYYNWESVFINSSFSDEMSTENKITDENELILPSWEHYNKLYSHNIKYVIFISNNKLYFEFPKKNKNGFLYFSDIFINFFKKETLENSINKIEDYKIEKIVDLGGVYVKFISHIKLPWKNQRLKIDSSLINRKLFIVDYLNKNCIS